MNYTLEQIDEAFNNLSPLTRRAMYYLETDTEIKRVIESFEIEDETRESIFIIVQYIIIGLMKYEDFENFLVSNLEIERGLSNKISNRIKNEIIDPLRERIDVENQFDSNIRNLEQSKNNEPPIPPYKKIEEIDDKKEDIPKTKEEVFYEKNGIEFLEKKEDKNEIILNGKEKNISFEDSGIDLVEEKTDNIEIFVPESEKNMIEGIEHPESITSGILGNKLKETYGPKITKTDYSIPKVNDNLNKSQ